MYWQRKKTDLPVEVFSKKKGKETMRESGGKANAQVNNKVPQSGEPRGGEGTNPLKGRKKKKRGGTPSQTVYSRLRYALLRLRRIF